MLKAICLALAAIAHLGAAQPGISLENRAAEYLREIRRLDPRVFPDLPFAVLDDLLERQCEIPQSLPTPHNVISGRFSDGQAADVAVLCYRHGLKHLLVYRQGDPQAAEHLGAHSAFGSGTAPSDEYWPRIFAVSAEDLRKAAGGASIVAVGGSGNQIPLTHDGIALALFDDRRPSADGARHGYFVHYWHGRWHLLGPLALDSGGR